MVYIYNTITQSGKKEYQKFEISLLYIFSLLWHIVNIVYTTVYYYKNSFKMSFCSFSCKEMKMCDMLHNNVSWLDQYTMYKCIRISCFLPYKHKSVMCKYF